MLLFNTPIVSSLHNPHVQTEKNPEGKNIFEVCVLLWKSTGMFINSYCTKEHKQTEEWSSSEHLWSGEATKQVN